MRKLFLLLYCAFLSIHCFAIDSDTFREPIVRPNESTLKSWLFNQQIIINPHKYWVDTTSKIAPERIVKLAAQGGSVFQKPPPFSNYATSVWTFEYPGETGHQQKYTATVTYMWTVTLFSGIDRKLSKIIITGPYL